MNAISVAQLAHYLQLTKRTVQRRARQQNWHCRKQLGLGGTRCLYTFIDLPVEVQTRVVASIVIEHQQLAEQNGIKSRIEKQLQASNWSNNSDPTDAQPCKDAIAPHTSAIAASHQLEEVTLDKSQVKQLVLQMADEYCQQYQLRKTKGLDSFCQAYNTRSLNIHELVYRYVARTSRSTLSRWQQQYNNHNLIAPNVAVNKHIGDVIDQITMIQPKMTAKLMHNYLLLLFKPHQVPNVPRILAYLHESIKEQ